MADQKNKPIICENPDPINRQSIQNRSNLYNEHKKLQENVITLNIKLEELKNSSTTPEIIENLKKEKGNLMALNEKLKRKLKYIMFDGPTKQSDIVPETNEKTELFETVKELGGLIEKVKKNEIFGIKQQENHTANLIVSLAKKLEEEEKKYEKSSELIRKLRQDDEKCVLRERITEMKQLINDIKVDNSKLKFENEQLMEDVENYKKQLNEAFEDVKIAAKKCYTLEDERDQLKKGICDLEKEKIQIKKYMIEEMNEANKAKKLSIDTELALQHIYEAYESKRQD